MPLHLGNAEFFEPSESNVFFEMACLSIFHGWSSRSSRSNLRRLKKRLGKASAASLCHVMSSFFSVPQHQVSHPHLKEGAQICGDGALGDGDGSMVRCWIDGLCWGDNKQNTLTFSGTPVDPYGHVRFSIPLALCRLTQLSAFLQILRDWNAGDPDDF